MYLRVAFGSSPVARVFKQLHKSLVLLSLFLFVCFPSFKVNKHKNTKLATLP